MYHKNKNLCSQNVEFCVWSHMPREPRNAQVERSVVFEIRDPTQSQIDSIDELAFMICGLMNLNLFTQKDQIYVECDKRLLKISIKYARGAWALKQAEKLMKLKSFPNVTRMLVVSKHEEIVYYSKILPFLFMNLNFIFFFVNSFYFKCSLIK